MTNGDTALATLRFVLLVVLLTVQFWLLSDMVRAQTNHQGEVVCLAYRNNPVVHAKCVENDWATP